MLQVHAKILRERVHDNAQLSADEEIRHFQTRILLVNFVPYNDSFRDGSSVHVLLVGVKIVAEIEVNVVQT